MATPSGTARRSPRASSDGRSTAARDGRVPRHHRLKDGPQLVTDHTIAKHERHNSRPAPKWLADTP